MITEPTDPRQAYIDRYEEPIHHMAALMGASIVTLDLPPRVLYPLADAGVKIVGELVRLYRAGLCNVRNIGTAAAAEIERILTFADLINID